MRISLQFSFIHASSQMYHVCFSEGSTRESPLITKLIVARIFHGSSVCRLTAITQLAHHGMIYVPLGYTFGSGMFEMNEVKGGSPYGAGTFAGDGTRQPTELELRQAFYQGKYVAEMTKKLKSQSPA